MVTRERQAARIRSLYLKAILRQDITFFDKETNTGEVIGRMSDETVIIQDAMGEKIGKFIQLIAQFIGGYTIAFIKGWLLSLVMLSMLPPLVLSGALMAFDLAKVASRGQSAYSEATIAVDQTIGSIRTVASFTGEKHAIAKYNKSLTETYKSGIYEGVALELGHGAVMYLVFSGYLLAIWFGARLIIDKGYNGGNIVTVIFAILTSSFSLGQASLCFSAFAAGQAAAFKMFQTINRKPEIDVYHSDGYALDDIRRDIELRDVYFTYPARPDEHIFSGFSLTIACGTTTALVGQSGSGKSTVISLIERFYDPQAGEVLIDGVNLKEFQLSWIREKIGLVSQEPVLFASSIKDNIAYEKDGATLEEIRAAAELANAANCIDKMPQGLDTTVGEHGTQLSRDQKQRVAIARAILKDPRILLLDEATSALNTESERIVQEALDRVMVNRTTVIVAHRLSTVRNADMITVIHRGRIVEKGSHVELLKDSDGAYYQLTHLQELRKESENQQDKTEITVESGKHSSERLSFRRSQISGDRNSSRHSFSVSFGVPTELNIQETTPNEYDIQYTKSNIEDKLEEVPLRHLAYLNKPEIPILFLGVISGVVNGVVFPTFAILFTGMIKTLYEPHSELRKDIKFWSLMFLALGVLCLVAAPATTYFFSMAGCRLIRRIRSMCFEKVVHMEVGWFDDSAHTSGAIGARLSADASTVRSLTGDALFLLVQNAATAIAELVIAFTASWQLALIILILLPLVGVNGWAQMKFMKGFSADAQIMYEEESQVASDAVGSIRTIASFCAEEKVMELYRKKCEGPMKSGIRQGLISGIGFGLSFFLLYVVYSISFYAGGRLVEDGNFFRRFSYSSKAKASTTSIFALLDRTSKIDSSDESGEIQFHHVNLKYPTRPEVQIFRDFCLVIRSSKTVALVGESGSGKSTVISMLQRFYDPDSGNNTLDGTEIQKFQQRVAIARAIVKEPKILLLDEATSALDTESERVVQDALNRVMVHRTTIVVAQRLATITNADLIAVVKDGVITEKGKHDKLINISDGVYASLVALHMSSP
ncbi:hypothetical protein GIB67_024859 [Kingdonia uniflora]|uniref:Uncharacterized protein n=1 Tax=Kingdonia uniflora TaxID=39325 RepID=A0A7J7NYJ2_9MAGN|nr:hypothetical protein GIB67_024859 [Kingdonia uniflora]